MTKVLFLFAAVFIVPVIVGLPKSNSNPGSEPRRRSPFPERLGEEHERDSRTGLKHKRKDGGRISGSGTVIWKPARPLGVLRLPLVDHTKDDAGPTQRPHTAARPMPFDPRHTWLTFLRHTERAEARNRKNAKAKQRVRSGGRYLPGPAGPPGPPGPRGPRGPSGANVTKEEMFENFRDLVRDVAEKRTQLIVDTDCGENCTSLLNTNKTLLLPPLIDIDSTAIIPRIPVAFIWRLSSDTRISRKTFIEIKNLNQPFMRGAFHRGETESSEEGRFKITKKGFYVFYVSVHILNRSPSTKKKVVGSGDVVTVLLCIDSMCDKNVSLESTSLLELARKFTISLNGILYLEEGQYVSVFVDNNSKFVIKVLEGSQLSGYLSGI